MQRLVITFCCSFPLFAQQPTEPKPSAPAAAAKLTAQSFLPDDHRNIAFADLKALRDRGIWDELEVSVLKVAFEQMRKELGCPLADLDRVTMVAAMLDSDGRMQTAQLSVMEGNKGLPLPPSVVGQRVAGTGWEPEQFGEFTVRRRHDELIVQPRAEVIVTGHAPWVEATLSGRSRGGQPCADLMSLLSGRADTLAATAFDLETPRVGELIKAQVFPDAKWPEGDAPLFLSARLLSSGADDDPHLGAEVVLRHRAPGAGVTASVQAIEATLQRWREDPTKQALRAVLKEAKVTVDRGDVVLRGDLGRARNAVGTLATLVMPIFARAGEPVQSERVVVEPVEPGKK
jgi:hypothetical protein